MVLGLFSYEADFNIGYNCILFLVKSFWKVNSIAALQVLPDESIVSCEGNYWIRRYNQADGKELSSRYVEHWADGKEVTLGGTQCLVISRKEYKSQDVKTR